MSLSFESKGVRRLFEEGKCNLTEIPFPNTPLYISPDDICKHLPAYLQGIWHCYLKLHFAAKGLKDLILKCHPYI